MKKVVKIVGPVALRRKFGFDSPSSPTYKNVLKNH